MNYTLISKIFVPKNLNLLGIDSSLKQVCFWCFITEWIIMTVCYVHWCKCFVSNQQQTNIFLLFRYDPIFIIQMYLLSSMNYWVFYNIKMVYFYLLLNFKIIPVSVIVDFITSALYFPIIFLFEIFCHFYDK